jgi:hypothetical protein
MRWAVPIMGDKAPAAWFNAASVGAEEMGMQQAHMSALQTKHAGLDARIAEENQRPMPDTALIARLKKEKLRIKEELSGL